MFDLLADIPFVALFIKFIIASTILFSAVWILEKIRLINTPDLAELAWKLAIAGSFLALLPVADILSSTLVIQDNRTAALIDDLNQNRPFSALVAEQSPKQSIEQLSGQPRPVPANLSADISEPQLQKEEPLKSTVLSEKENTTAAETDNAPIREIENDSESNKEKTFWYSAADLRTKDLAALGWAALVLLTLGALMFSYRDAVKNLGSRKRVEAENKANQILRALCEKAGIRHVPYLSRSETIKSPVCLPRKEICLPNWAFDDMPEAEFKSLLAHELGHLVRRDPIMLMALQILSRVFFFQPLFIIARKRLTDIAELAADEWAAKQAADSRSVANALFTCATKIHETRQIQWGMAMAGNKSILKQRVERLIHAQTVPFKTAGTFAKTALGVGVIGLSLGLPSVEFAGAMTAESSMGLDLHDISTPKLAPVAPIAPVPTVPRAPATNLAPFVSTNTGNQTPAPFASAAVIAKNVAAATATAHPHGNREFHRRRGDSGSMNWNSGGKSISAKWEGDFRISADDSFIEPEDEDGSLRIKTKEDGEKRSIKFEIEDGKRVHTYKVNGDKKELDAAGKKWLKNSIQQLIKSGFGAKQRVARILKTSKVKGVLKETSRFDSDFVKRLYLTETMDQAKLKDKEIAQAVDIIVTFDSDFEKRLALSFMLEEENPSDKILPKVLKVAKGIDSDFEKRLLVTQYVSELKLTDKSIGLVIDVAETIDSDFELRLLLTSMLKEAKLTEKNAQRVLNVAIKNIDSDFEMRLLLTSFADQYDGSDAVVSKVLVATDKIDSDFEQRLLLSTIVNQNTLSEKNWLTAISIAGKINSDFEKGQALTHFRAEIPKDNKKVVAALDKAMEGMDQQFTAVREFSSNKFQFEHSDEMAEFREAMREFTEEMAELEIEHAEIVREFGGTGSKEAKKALREKQREIRQKEREMLSLGRNKDRIMRQVERAKAEAVRQIERELARVNRELRSADRDLQRDLQRVLRDLERTRDELKRQFRDGEAPAQPKQNKEQKQSEPPQKSAPTAERGTNTTNL